MTTRKADGIRRRWCKPSRRHNRGGRSWVHPIHHPQHNKEVHPIRNPIPALAYIVTAAVYIIKTAPTTAPEPPTPSTYPLAGVVVQVDRAAELVTFRTGSGQLFTLTGCDDWLAGDVVACTMSDNATPDDITDDIILDYRYCGYVS